MSGAGIVGWYRQIKRFPADCLVPVLLTHRSLGLSALLLHTTSITGPQKHNLSGKTLTTTALPQMKLDWGSSITVACL